MSWSIPSIGGIDWAGAFSWASTNKPAAIVLSTTIVVYPIRYFVPRMFPRLLRRRGRDEREVAIRSVLLARLWGGIVLGIPALWIAFRCLPHYPNRLGLNVDHAGISIIAAVISWIVIWLTFSVMVRVWPGFFTGYPEMKVRPPWPMRLILLNTVSWFVYLIPYEFLFRGFLLYPLASAYGGAMATLISMGLYSFAHVVNEPQEQSSTILAGILFSGLALGTGSILAPVLIHCCLAPSMELFALRAESRAGAGTAVRTS
jgi:membrane protease YdiL (CAAX protease family)